MSTVLVPENIQQFHEMIAAKEDSLLSFSTPSCAKCKMLAPTVTKLVTESTVAVQLIKIDASVLPELAELYSVTEVPSFIRLNRGKQIARLSGIVSTDELNTLIGG